MSPSIDALINFIDGCKHLLVLTGAGCSTASGIPDYRDEHGEWKRAAPIQFRDFTGSDSWRRRYWARSAAGWPRVAQAKPNGSHRALATLEIEGHITQIVTQNVDRLHQRAGSRNVIDLHGRLDEVACLECNVSLTRDAFQLRLNELNPNWRHTAGETAPDGDVDLGDADYEHYCVPSCENCGGVMKPRVVFFGEPIPTHVTQAANQSLDDADGLLVVGSSLMVFSGYRFARSMSQRGLPTAAVNLGRTRADDLLDLKVTGEAGAVLRDVANALTN